MSAKEINKPFNKQNEENMEILFLSIKEKVAVTNEDGYVQFWEPRKGSQQKIFSNRKGEKVILGRSERFQSQGENAGIASYLMFWMGEYPWSSWCVAVAQHTMTKKISLEVFETEINPRGITASEQWKYYISTQEFWDKI